MKKLILVLLLSIPLISDGQSNIIWVQNTRGVSIAADNTGNVYTADYDYNPAGDIYLTKRDSGGSLFWEVKFDQTDNTKWEKATWVETDNLGNIIVTGNLMSGYSNPVNAAGIIMKFSPDGNLLWRNVYENSFDGSYTIKCIIDGSNNIYVLGAGISSQFGFTTKVKKFSQDGSEVWTYYNGGGIGAPVNFKFSRDNNIVIAARSVYGSINGYAKLDINGNPIWSISGISSQTIGDIAGDDSGNSYIVHAENVINGRTTIRKINPSGNQVWLYNYNLKAQRIETGEDNLPVAAGYPLSSFGSAFVKVDENGNQIWLNPDADGIYNLLLHAQLKIDAQNNIYLAAGTLTEMAICKVSANGNSAWTRTMPGSYANGFEIGNDNNIYVVGGSTVKIGQSNVSAVNLTMSIEGFYNSNSNNMISDSIRVYLRNTNSPYSTTDSATGIISASGNISLNFNNTVSGQYYIVIKHRNSIETWSRQGGESITSGNVVSYNFSDQITKAFGNNMKQVDNSPIRFANFSGDINQDGTIDASDMSIVENDAGIVLTGYVKSDVTGDNFVDAEDISVIDNNVEKGVIAITP